MGAPVTDISTLFGLPEFGAALLVKATLILGLAWIVGGLLRRKSAAVRHALWSLAFSALILLPILTLSVPAWPVALPGWLTPSISDPSAVLVDRQTGTDGRHADPEGTGPAMIQVEGAIPEVAAEPPLPATTPASERGASLPTGMLLLAGWSVVAALLLLRLLVRLSRIGNLTRGAIYEAGNPAACMANVLTRELGVRRTVRVLHHPRIPMPVTWGIYRPAILLPLEARRWSRERLRAVLAHELAHISRLDYVVHLVSEAACAVYWVNPLVWAARRRLYAEQERACDDLVLNMGTRSFEYAEHLLHVARAFHTRRVPGGGIAMARETGLKGRVRAILDQRRNRRPLSHPGWLFLTLAVACAALPLAALRPELHHGTRIIPPANGLEAVPPDAAAPAAPSMQGPVLLWMEAEDAALSEPMQLEGNLEASGGRFIEVRDDHDSRDHPPAGGHAVYNFDVPKAGSYALWGRVTADDGDEDSFWIQMDGGRWIKWNSIRHDDDWHWGRVRDWDQDDRPVVFDMVAGAHALTVAYREDDARLDRLLLTDSTSFVPEERGPGQPGFRPVYLWMEAEGARLTYPMQRGEQDRASGAKYAWVPDREDRGHGDAVFTFTVTQGGAYVLWGRAIGKDDDENSFFVSLDGGQEVVWDIPGRDPEATAKRWTWDPIGAREERGAFTDPAVLSLKPGRHTVRVRNRESGARLDGVLVTNDLRYEPSGRRPLLPPSQPAYVWLEAERTQTPAAIQVEPDPDASGAAYVAVQAGRKSMEAPPQGGRLAYRFTATRSGLYVVWARVLAPDDGSNSFWLRMDRGEWVRWNGIRNGKHWRWSTVRDADYGMETMQFELPAGAHTLELAYREDGIRLDRLLVTNDPLFRPDGKGTPPP
ncbi:MAG TPA: M56 family metallopeptidase [Rhodothermales bacterium]|nr:M56 family metallopeptidase [Rhodothermales bacterium]